MRGHKPERWVRQTDFGNDEAVGYLVRPAGPARRRGRPWSSWAPSRARRSSIGGDEDGVVFDFAPQLEAGAEQLRSPRGTDRRVEAWEREQ